MDWKKSFLITPSISVRRGISDVYDEPYEDTSTLVLTTMNHRFIDIRFPTQTLHNEEGTPQPLILHPSFWAFSGVSHTTFYDRHSEARPGYNYTAHTIFKHDIDTKEPGITDEGDCFLLPNGDVMEVGVWSDTGKLYKELWTEPVPTSCRKEILKKPVVLAETVGDVAMGRGLIIRIGDYIQGIFERTTEVAGGVHEDKVLVQRWVRDIYEEGPDPEWRLEPRSNEPAEGLLPCEIFTQSQNFEKLEFEHQRSRWRVTEYQP